MREPEFDPMPLYVHRLGDVFRERLACGHVGDLEFRHLVARRRKCVRCRTWQRVVRAEGAARDEGKGE